MNRPIRKQTKPTDARNGGALVADAQDAVVEGEFLRIGILQEQAVELGQADFLLLRPCPAEQLLRFSRSA